MNVSLNLPTLKTGKTESIPEVQQAKKNWSVQLNVFLKKVAMNRIK